MYSEKLRRRGTTSEHKRFIGSLAEVTYDTDKKIAVVHNAKKLGGYNTIHENHSHESVFGPGNIVGSIYKKTIPQWIPTDGSWVANIKAYDKITEQFSTQSVSLYDIPILEWTKGPNTYDFVPFNTIDGRWIDSDGIIICFIYAANSTYAMLNSDYSGGIVSYDILSGQWRKIEMWSSSGGSNQYPYSIKYCGGLWIVIGANNRVYTSEDANNWHYQSLGYSTVRSIGYDYDNDVIMITSYRRVTRSTDKGENWVTIGAGSTHINSITYGDGKWCIGDTNGNVYISSNSGDSWSHVHSFGSSCTVVTHTFDETGDGRFTCGSIDGQLKYSDDGITWLDCTFDWFVPSSFINGNSSNGMWVATAIHDRSPSEGELIHSTDGKFWKRFNRLIKPYAGISSKENFGEVFQVQFDYKKTGDFQGDMKLTRYVADGFQAPLIEAQNELITFYMKS